MYDSRYVWRSPAQYELKDQITEFVCCRMGMAQKKSPCIFSTRRRNPRADAALNRWTVCLKPTNDRTSLTQLDCILWSPTAIVYVLIIVGLDKSLSLPLPLARNENPTAILYFKFLIKLTLHIYVK